MPARKADCRAGPGGRRSSERVRELLDPTLIGALHENVDAIRSWLRRERLRRPADRILAADRLGQGDGEIAARTGVGVRHREDELRHRRMIGTAANA